MRTLALTLAAAAALIPSVAHAQHAMTGAKTKLDFNAYTGSGFVPTPAAGQLDSDEWVIFGNSDIHDPNSASTYLPTTLGGSYTTGDLARGASATGVSTGGMYAFTVATNNNAFGWKPSSADLTGASHAGVFTLYLVNSSGVDMVDPTIKFNDYVLNDQARSNSITFAWSTDDTTYTDVAALDLASPAAPDTTPAWVETPQQVTLTGTTIPNGGSLYLRWKTNDLGGSGSRDELAFDDVTVVVPGCGDGISQNAEACDDDNNTDGDGCSATCTVEHGYDCGTAFPSVCASTCGDGLVAADEGCDDSGTTAGDGCSDTCTEETGFDCTGEPSTCASVCGDGVLASDEGCDDGVGNDGDGCSAACVVETGWTCPTPNQACVPLCGDGMMVGGETCDDGGTTAGDGCDATCAQEDGYECSGAPSTCVTVCGDGFIRGTETCDDQNTTAGDGCDDTCTTETGYTCTGEPSACTMDSLCGNGALDGVEQCDDGGIAPGDGCSDTCTVEPNYVCSGEPSTCEVDGDGDSIADSADNCPEDANPAQTDADGDGIGDICDDTPTPDQPTAQGCCSTGGGSEGGFALAAIVGLALVRRRKRA